jgi:hypothetical protein
MKTFINAVLFLAFVVIIILLLVATNNTIVTNRAIEKNISELKFQNDSIGLNELSFEKHKEKTLELKNHLLDANTISYLFQVLTILLIGVGFYLLTKIQDNSKELERKLHKIDKKILNIERHESKVFSYLYNVRFSTNLINFANAVFSLSLDLNESKVLSDRNIDKSYTIEDLLSDIIIFIEKNKFGRLTINEKYYLQSIFNDKVKRKIDILTTKCAYYETVKEKLDVVIKRIDDIEIENTAANNVYK